MNIVTPEVYNFYIWFRPPVVVVDDESQTPEVLQLLELLKKSKNIVSFPLLKSVVDAEDVGILKTLNFIFNMFLPHSKYTTKVIQELQKEQPGLSILEGDRIFVRELNKCWECTKDGWELVNIGTSI